MVPNMVVHTEAVTVTRNVVSETMAGAVVTMHPESCDDWIMTGHVDDSSTISLSFCIRMDLYVSSHSVRASFSFSLDSSDVDKDALALYVTCGL